MRVSRPRRTRGRPRLDEVADIENTLLDVALEEFLQHGYGGASVSRIVKNARMSKTTVYSRFSSKEALFHGIIEAQIARLAPDSVLNAGNQTLSLEEGLEAFANHILERSFEGEMLSVNRLMYSESHRFPELAAEAARRSQLGIQRIADFIRERAALDGVPCNDPQSVAEVFILTVRGWYIDILLTGGSVTAQQRRDWVRKSVRVLTTARENW
ncbi:TetR/AcrR family transcriptional regulator [Haliea sp. E17]|uniref:TetR/AcrR family transcriptional regulator n=1 Tax=Haliea sp. E17 TaxID=3401576 RepID=UPI003AAEC5CD